MDILWKPWSTMISSHACKFATQYSDTHIQLLFPIEMVLHLMSQLQSNTSIKNFTTWSFDSTSTPVQ
jgi:hypothetical protein